MVWGRLSWFLLRNSVSGDVGGDFRAKMPKTPLLVLKNEQKGQFWLLGRYFRAKTGQNGGNDEFLLNLGHN